MRTFRPRRERQHGQGDPGEDDPDRRLAGLHADHIVPGTLDDDIPRQGEKGSERSGATLDTLSLATPLTWQSTTPPANLDNESRLNPTGPVAGGETCPYRDNALDHVPGDGQPPKDSPPFNRDTRRQMIYALTAGRCTDLPVVACCRPAIKMTVNLPGSLVRSSAIETPPVETGGGLLV